MSNDQQTTEFLTRRQRLERRRLEIYADERLTNKSDPMSASLHQELDNIRRELSGMGPYS